MEIDRFYEGVPEAPCAGCRHHDWCDRDRLACWNFATWCESGSRDIWFWKRYPDLPNAEIYNHLYPNEVVEFPL